MSLGPIEILVVGFPGSQFNGTILPALEDVVAKGIVSIVDCMLITKNQDGSVDFIEVDEVDASPDVAKLAALMDEVNGLLNDEDIEEFAAGLEPGDSAAALVFEHTWAKPFRDAIVDSGGVLLANLRVPGAVVDEVLDALNELEEE